MNLDEVKELALKEQRRAIRTWMLSKYMDESRIINKWSDHYFSLSWFFTPVSPIVSDSTVRKWMRKLAETGAVEVRQWRKGGSICYRFSREVCEQAADEAVKHWQAVGYSQDERRPAIEPLPAP